MRVPPVTYLVYDLETTGLTPAFDQVLQFAGVRLNEHFEEIERYNIRVKLSEDVIPNPQALLVNHTSVAMLSEGISEYEAIQQIHDLLNTPGTISVGYNSLGFDDEFLRFSFFRHLLPPYRHQYANHCLRMDIFPIVLLAYQIAPHLLQWPERDGKPCFKLEYLVKANNCGSGVSHDALVDVLDTVALIKLLRRDVAFWAEATAFFHKAQDRALFANNVSSCPIGGVAYKLALAVEKQPNTPPIPVLCLGDHKTYENQTRWLRLDDVSFSAHPGESLKEHVKTLRKKWTEPPFLFSPEDERLSQKLSLEEKMRVDDNLRFLQENVALFQQIKEQKLTETYPDHPNYDPNGGLYKLQFAKKGEEEEKEREQTTEHLCRSFHLLEDARKQEVVQKLGIVNKLYQALAVRLMGRYMSSRLSPNDRFIYDMYLARVFRSSVEVPMLDHRGQAKLSLPEALTATEKLLSAAKSPEERGFLSALQNWYMSHLEKYKKPLTTHVDVGTQTESDVASRKRHRDDVVNPLDCRGSFFAAVPQDVLLNRHDPSDERAYYAAL